MITGISFETKDYISEKDTTEPKTVWKIGALDSDIFDSLGGDSNPLKVMSEIVRFGLKGFENFKDSFGNEVKFSTVTRPINGYSYKVVADNIMKILPPELKTELGTQILKMSKLEEKEAKN